MIFSSKNAEKNGMIAAKHTFLPHVGRQFTKKAMPHRAKTLFSEESSSVGGKQKIKNHWQKIEGFYIKSTYHSVAKVVGNQKTYLFFVFGFTEIPGRCYGDALCSPNKAEAQEF